MNSKGDEEVEENEETPPLEEEAPAAVAVETIDSILSDPKAEEVQEQVDEQNVIGLEEDVFSLMFLEDFNAVWFFAFAVVLMQLLIIVLFYWDLLFQDYSDQNKFQIPITVDTNVRIAQFIAMPLAVMSHEDATTALFLLGAQFDPKVTEKHPHATIRAWFTTLALRFVVGFALIVVSFAQIMQSTRITDLFLNLEAIVLVGNIDNFAFYLADKGFLKKELKDACAKVREVEFNKSAGAGRTIVKRFCMFFIWFSLIIGWIITSQRQDNGRYLRDASCQYVNVQFGDQTLLLNATALIEPLSETSRSYFPYFFEGNREMVYSYFSRTYKIAVTSGRKDIAESNYRPVYHEVLNEVDPDYYDDSYGRFEYCDPGGNDEGSWIYTIPAIAKTLSRPTKGEDCPGWLLRSAATDAFQLTDVPKEGWRIWTGSVESADDFSYSCTDCEQAVDCGYRGKCNEDAKTCECNDDTLGYNCRLDFPCRVVEGIFFGTDSYDYEDFGEYTLLNKYLQVIAEGEEYTRDDLLLVYERPVYASFKNLTLEVNEFNFTGDVNGNGTAAYFDVIFYGGNRWVLTETDFFDFIYTFAFPTIPAHSLWDGLYTGEIDSISEVTSSGTPTGLKWEYLLPSRSRGTFGPYLAREPGNLDFHCIGGCTGSTNLCGIYGQCIDGRCRCNDCFGGYYCEYSPFDPYNEDLFNSIIDILVGSNTTVPGDELTNDYFKAFINASAIEQCFG